MVKAQFAIRIEVDVWERIQESFPRQASPMIEEFLKDVLSTGSNDGISKEELQEKLLTIKKNRAEVEREERVIQQQIKTFDAEVEKRNELFNSDEAKQIKEVYFEVSHEIRGLFSEICSELEALKIKDFGTPIVPFDFYFKFKDDVRKKVFDIADENNYFKLKSLLLQFNRKTGEFE